MNDFLSLVAVHFDFLIAEYGYSLKLVRSDPAFFGNAVIRCESGKVGLNVVLDRGQVSMYVGQLSVPEGNWFDICDVVRYYHPQIEAVCSLPDNLSYDENIDFQLKRLAEMVQSFCGPVLQGDFSAEKAIRDIQEKRRENLKNELKRQYPQLRDLE